MVPQKNRNKEGKFESEHGVNRDDILDAMDTFTPYTTGELAENLGIPRRTAYKYLQSLAEENKITKKKPDPRRVIWMRGG